MTDLELLELINSKSPDELSVEEIEQLRAGIVASPELRREVAERVEMEQYLHHALARVNLSVDDIITQADARAAGPTGTLAKLGLVACAVLGCLIGLAVVMAIVSPQPPEPLKLSARPSDDEPKSSQKVLEDAQLASGNNDSAPSPSDKLLADNPATADKTLPETQVAQATQEPASATPSTEPWDLDLKAAENLPQASLDLFRSFDAAKLPPNGADLQRWFAPVDGQRGDFGTRDISGGQWGLVEGVLRLRSPLKSGTALSLTLWDWGNVRIHTWAGNQGASIYHYGQHHNKPWGGYVTRRTDAAPIPKVLELAATDDGRFWRTYPKQPTTLQLRHHNGLLTISHGDVRLIDVPMRVAPTEIYLAGSLLVREITMIPAAELPPLPTPLPVAAEIIPAKQEWKQPAEGTGTLTQHEDDSSELKVEKTPNPVFASFQLPRQTVHELVFEIEAPQVGMGICLVGADGNPIHIAAFLRNKETGLTQWCILRPGEPRIENAADPNAVAVSYITTPAWLKLIVAPGWVKCLTSVDGQYWASAGAPWSENAGAGVSGVGLYAIQNDAARSIRLRKVTLREFDAITSLTTPELLKSATEIAEAAEWLPFSEAALKTKPAEAKPADWLRACAIRRLAWGSPAPLGEELLRLLWQDSLKLKRTHEERLRLLDQIMVFAPSWLDANQSLRQVRYYEEFGDILADLDKPNAYQRIARPEMVAPIWAHNVFDYVPIGLARREGLELANEKKWDELDAFTRRFNFYNFPEKTRQEPFYKWITALASQQRPRQNGSSSLAVLADWRHPLVSELSKEGFNVLADLQVALDSGAYRDACQVIGSATSSGMVGLLPDTQDADLSVSLPATVSLAMREHPQFKETMAEEFGPLGRLRVRQAISSGDASIVEVATLQFYGTEAAAEAHLWLGDRALSSGAFAAAQGHYRAARATASNQLLDRLGASEQLAAAMMGRDAGQKPQGTITLGDSKIAASEIVKLANELRASRAAESAIGQAAAGTDRAVRLPGPRNYEPTARARLEGEVGNNPNNVPGEYQQPGPDWPPFSVDWVSRQSSVLQLEGRVLVSNRFQLASYDPTTGALQWRAGLGGDQAQSHDWPQAPMRPLATPQLAFVRRLRASGPTLSAIDLTTGQPKWETKLEGERWVISDPSLVEGTLYACTVQHTDVGYTLKLGTFDPQTGVLLRERDLVSLRENWWRTRDCQMLAVDESFVITCAGAVMRCDLMGNLRWARKQLWIPPAVDSFWMLQAQAPPMLEGGALYVVQPCVPAVVALEPDSGRLIWKANLPTVRRLLGVIGKQLFVETSAGVRSLDTATGKRKWQFDTQELLDGYVASQEDGLLLATSEPIEKENARQVSLIWLDPATGKPRHTLSLPQLKHDRPYLGPMFVRGDRIWAFSGKGIQDANRDLFEFVPK